MNKFERAPYPEHPSRCQATGERGQCPFMGVILPDGQYAKYCPRHGGNKQTQAQLKDDRRMYLVAKWQERIKNQADHPKLKSLHEEVGILRMAFETKLNSIKDDTDLLLNAQSITTAIREIRETVAACAKLEQSTNQMLDRSQALAFVQDIIGIIGNYIGDEPDILQMISEDMVESFDKLVGK